MSSHHWDAGTRSGRRVLRRPAVRLVPRTRSARRSRGTTPRFARHCGRQRKCRRRPMRSWRTTTARPPHPVGRWDGREWICHPNLRSGLVKHERMLFVQPSPGGQDIVRSPRRGYCDLRGCRRSSEIHEELVRESPQPEVALVHYFARITTGAHAAPRTSRTGFPFRSFRRTVRREAATVTCA